MQGLEELLPFAIGGLQAGLGAAVGFALLLGFRAHLPQPLLVLAQALAELLALGFEGADLFAELLAGLAALLLLLQPAARAASHFPQAAAGELHGSFGGATGGFSVIELALVGGGIEVLLLLAQVPLGCGQLPPLPLQGLGIELVLVRLPGQFAAAGFQAGQFGLHGNQLIFTEGFDLLLQLLQLGGRHGQLGFGLADRFLIGELLFGEGLLAAG